MSDQSMDQSQEPIQTEPQDLSVKRPRNEEPLEESEHTVSTDTDGTTIVERPTADNGINTDQTSANLGPNNHHVHQVIKDLVCSQYEQKLFWDNVLEQSKKSDNLDSLKEILIANDIDVQPLIDAKDKAKPIANCDNELRHLLTKLKFVNQLFEGYINKTKDKISEYTIKDFCPQ